MIAIQCPTPSLLLPSWLISRPGECLSYYYISRNKVLRCSHSKLDALGLEASIQFVFCTLQSFCNMAAAAANAAAVQNLSKELNGLQTADREKDLAL